MRTLRNPHHSDRQLMLLLLQFEIDQLAAYLDAAVRDPAVSCDDVAIAAMRHARLIVQLKAMQDRVPTLMGARGYA